MKQHPAEAADRELVTDLAREVVHRVAPGELRSFRFTSEAYFADPQRALKGDRTGDGVLGNGLNQAVEVLTPIALAVSSEVALYLVGGYVAGGVVRLGRAATGAVRRLIRARSEDDGASGAVGPIVELTAEERREVRRIVREVVTGNGHSEEVAQEISDALTGVEPEPEARPEGT